MKYSGKRGDQSGKLTTIYVRCDPLVPTSIKRQEIYLIRRRGRPHHGKTSQLNGVSLSAQLRSSKMLREISTTLTHLGEWGQDDQLAIDLEMKFSGAVEDHPTVL